MHILKPEGEGEGESERSVREKGQEGSMEEDRGVGQVPQLMDLDPQAERKRQAGEELDRVFGGLKV